MVVRAAVSAGASTVDLSRVEFFSAAAVELEFRITRKTRGADIKPACASQKSL